MIGTSLIASGRVPTTIRTLTLGAAGCAGGWRFEGICRAIGALAENLNYQIVFGRS